MTYPPLPKLCLSSGGQIVQGVPLVTEPGISLIVIPLMRILQRIQTHTTDTLLFISHTTNVLLFKFRCNIFIGVRIIKEMPGSVANGTHCIIQHLATSHSVAGRPVLKLKLYFLAYGTVSLFVSLLTFRRRTLSSSF